MAKISACIISFNEENKIEDCLKSMEGIIDEIVVIDSGSTDRTVEIASKYTNKIYSQKFLGHVKQKTMAVSKANYDWVLSLDCDERLSEKLQESIRGVKDMIDLYDAYKMPRKTFYIYHWLNHCWYPDTKIRLFNKHKAKWGGINPHDSVLVRSHSIKQLQGDILHFSFDTVSSHIQTLDKFTEIGAQELLKKGRKVTVAAPFTHAFWIFLKMYFLKRGFLDGFPGALASILSFTHVFVKYSKVIIYQRTQRK